MNNSKSIILFLAFLLVFSFSNAQNFNLVKANTVEYKSSFIDGPKIDTLIKYKLHEDGIVIHHSDDVLVFLSNIEYPGKEGYCYPAIFRFEKKGSNWEKIYAHYFYAELTRKCAYGDEDAPEPQAVYEPKTGNIVVFGNRFSLFFEHKTQKPTYMTGGDYKYTNFYDGVVLCDSLIAIAGEVDYEGGKSKTVVYLYRTGIMKSKWRSFDMGFDAGCPQLVRISDNSFYCYNSKSDSLDNNTFKLRKITLDRKAKEGKGSLIVDWEKELIVKSKKYADDNRWLTDFPKSNTFEMINNKLVILYRWPSARYYSIGTYDLNGNLIWDKIIPNDLYDASYDVFIDTWDDGTILFGYEQSYNNYDATELFSIGLDGEVKNVVQLPHQIENFNLFKGTINDFITYAQWEFNLRKFHITIKQE
ncbi:MAG: hypothetical protein R2799_05400 [Crocinitomicaceae bacterium]